MTIGISWFQILIAYNCMVCFQYSGDFENDHFNSVKWTYPNLESQDWIKFWNRKYEIRPNYAPSFPIVGLAVNTGTGRQSECGISCSEPMPKLSHSQRFSMSGRIGVSFRTIGWFFGVQFRILRLIVYKNNVNEILSNLIVYSLKCTKNRHRFSFMKTLARYLCPLCCLPGTTCIPALNPWWCVSYEESQNQARNLI